MNYWDNQDPYITFLRGFTGTPPPRISNRRHGEQESSWNPRRHWRSLPRRTKTPPIRRPTSQTERGGSRTNLRGVKPQYERLLVEAT